MDVNQTVVIQDHTSNESDSFLDKILLPLLSIPIVRVNRDAFLLETFKKYPQDKITLLLEKGPVKSGICSQDELKTIAKGLCNKRKLQTAATGFFAGLPGGIAMLGTIPADIAQFFGVSLKLAQELSYLYGRDDFWKGDQITDKAKTELALYLSTMLGVAGAASTMNVISKPIGKEVGKHIARQKLTKTAWYPILKKICRYIGIKLTKDSLNKSIAKAIPILGGVVAGGINYLALGTMSGRLITELDKAFEYTEDEIQSDLENIKKNLPEIYDAIFTEVE